MDHWAVCSGGNTKGADQAGRMRAVDEVDPITHTLGSSIGAVNSLLLSYLGSKMMTDQWLSMKKRSDILGTHFFSFLFNRRTGWYNMKPLGERLYSIARSTKRRIPAWATYVDFNTAQLFHTQNVEGWERNFVDAVLRSSSVSPAHTLIENRYGDGGYMEQTPLQFAIKGGATKISVFLTAPLSWESISGWEVSGIKPLSAALRGLEIMIHQNFRRDIRKCLRKNEKPGFKKIDLRIYAPSRVLTELDDNDIQPKVIKKVLNDAYKETRKQLKTEGKIH